MSKTIKFKPIILSLGLIVVASLCYALGTSMMFVFSFSSIQNMYLTSLIAFMPLGFIFLPVAITSKQTKENKSQEVKFNLRQYIVISVVIFLINNFFLHSEEYFHQMIISMCEEVLFRYIIYSLIRKNYSYSLAILITSVLFGFILHMDYPILDNLLIRTPLGILFSILATKIGLQYAIAGHWLYNLIVSKISF